MAWEARKYDRLHPDDRQALILAVTHEINDIAHAMIHELYGPAIVSEISSYREQITQLQGDLERLKHVLEQGKIQKALEILRS